MGETATKVGAAATAVGATATTVGVTATGYPYPFPSTASTSGRSMSSAPPVVDFSGSNS